MGNSESTVYDTSYSAPVSYPAVDIPPVKQIPQPQLPKQPSRSKGIEIKRGDHYSFRHDHAGVVQSSYAGESHGVQPIKIVILGKESVGKASFVNRTTKSSPDKRYCGTETVFRTMQLRKTNVTFQIVVCARLYIISYTYFTLLSYFILLFVKLIS
jgi:hypothetical protein